MERFINFFRNLLRLIAELSIIQKVILAGVGIGLVFVVYFSLSFPVQEERVYLFKKALTLKEVAAITVELDRLNVPYEVLEDKYITLENEKTGTVVRMELAQKNLLPDNIKGWELFDIESWTTTEFDRDIKLRRAIEGEIRRHLESLKWIEASEVSISAPEKSLYTDRAEEVQAAVTITPAEGYRDYLTNKSVIKGIENILSTGIDGLSKDNIVITDHTGNQINLFAGEDFEDQVKQAMEQNKVRDLETRKIVRRVEENLEGVLSSDRYRVAVDIELNFDKQTIDQKEILPVVIKERTPNLAYDDSVIRDNVRVSRKNLKENFEGFGFVPEGPAGQEPNLPPGYKESLEGKNIYQKNEEIDNFVNGEKVTKQTNDAYEIERKSVSVAVDGIWKKQYDENGDLIIENENIKRIYTPVSEQELQNLEQIVRGAVNFNAGRSDTVVVKNIAFDRQAQFEEEDAAYFREQRIRLTALIVIFSTLGILGLYFAYRFIAAAIQRRKLAKLEEENLIRQLHREEALSDLDQVVSKEPDMTDEEKEILRIQEEINMIAEKSPAEVGRVITTVLSETN